MISFEDFQPSKISNFCLTKITRNRPMDGHNLLSTCAVASIKRKTMQRLRWGKRRPWRDSDPNLHIVVFYPTSWYALLRRLTSMLCNCFLTWDSYLRPLNLTKKWFLNLLKTWSEFSISSRQLTGNIEINGLDVFSETTRWSSFGGLCVVNSRLDLTIQYVPNCRPWSELWKGITRMTHHGSRRWKLTRDRRMRDTASHRNA